jgi:nucleoside-diphosphate-sugar epimerase
MTTEVIVTGASGFFGQAVIRQFANSEFAVRGVARRRREGLVAVSDYSMLPNSEDAILIHLAQGANTSDSFGEEDIELCATFAGKPWRHIVYASSAVVYGDAKASLRTPDEGVTPYNDYSRVKLACEKIVLEAGGTCLRLGNLYGPGMNVETVISAILSQIPGDGPLVLQNTAPIRDFMWVDDAAACLIAACRRMPGEILNVASGRGFSVGDVAHMALTLAGEGGRPVVGKIISSRNSCLVLDIARTCSLLNWVPEMELADGLEILLREKKNVG